MPTFFSIEKNVPTPSQNLKYQWDKMEIGDSFLIPLKSVSSVRSIVSARNRKYGCKYIIRNVDEASARVWRVK